MAAPAAPDDSPDRYDREGIPKAAVGRLSLYLRELRRLRRDGVESISSRTLGQLLGVTGAVVRRDLATLGSFGRRGVGYQIAPLVDQIRRVLGTNRPWRVVLIGAGSLGHALLRYRGFDQQGFRLVAAIDADPHRIGQQIAGVEVLGLEQLEKTLAESEASLAILAVPAEAAQSVAQRLSRAGITGILNFAPVTLRVAPTTCVVNVDLASELQRLSYAVVSGEEASAPVEPDPSAPPVPPAAPSRDSSRESP